MSTAFFSPDFLNRDNIEKPTVKFLKADDIVKTYEIDRCKAWISNGSYVSVAIQFPDELLCDSAAIVEKLESVPGVKIFILGDTSYGSCCVDEVAAQHLFADAIIHFGHACLSPTSRLPVLHIFERRPVDCLHCLNCFKESFANELDKVIVMYETAYVHMIGELFTAISKTYKNVILSELKTPNLKTEDEIVRPDCNTVTRCNRIVPLPINENLENYVIFYLGRDNVTLRNFMMTYNKCAFHTYNPETRVCRKETLDINKSLMKRYYMIERVKDADIIGIVAGTLGVTDYLLVIERLKRLVKNSGKKSYTFLVGKLNVAKLANFMEIDVFVLISCPENTLIDSTEFYKPVVTPFEVEIALNSQREWTGDYITDFQELLPGAANFMEIPPAGECQPENYVSLFSERVRILGREDSEEEASTNSSLVSCEHDSSVSTVKALSASEFLGSRSWHGLQQDLGVTPVTKATEGRSGIAASYDDETEPT